MIYYTKLVHTNLHKEGGWYYYTFYTFGKVGDECILYANSSSVIPK
jgi:hypothetical protein